MKRPVTWLLAIFTVIVLPGAALPQDKPKQEPPKKQDEQEELKKKAAEYRKEVTETRGMKYKTDVGVGLYSKDELLAFLKKEFEKEAPKEKVEMWAKVYRHFGLIPKDLDLYQAYLDLFGSAIAGFYHPKSKELRLIRAGDGDSESKAMEEQFEQMFGVKLEDVTLVHELTHAAQDQNFDLSTLPMDGEENDDMIAAMKGLIEGDASAVGWKWGLKDKYSLVIKAMNDSYKSGQLPGKAGALPAYLRKTLAFPYGYGTDFVNDVLKNANEDWTAIDKAFGEMPLSTEQILHPKKYYGGERDWPKDVTIKDVDKIADGWKRLATNVHGEFVVGLLLDEHRAGSKADRKKAREGWGGDRYYVFEKGKDVCSIWYTNWDSKDDAVEFFDVAIKLLENKYKDVTPEKTDTKVTFSWKGGKAVIERKDADVLILDNVDDALAGKGADLFGASAKTELKKIERLKMIYHCPKHAEEKSHKVEKCDKCGAEMIKDEMKK